MREYFKKQVDYYPKLTQEVLDKVEFKTVWSGNRIMPGDIVVYAYVYLLNSDELKAITFLERELDNLHSTFKFIKMENDFIPIIAFKNDIKKRTDG